MARQQDGFCDPVKGSGADIAKYLKTDGKIAKQNSTQPETEFFWEGMVELPNG